MLCPNCEAENRDDAKFCDECGFPLSGSLARLGAAPAQSRPTSSYAEDAPAETGEMWDGLAGVPAEPASRDSAEAQAGFASDAIEAAAEPERAVTREPARAARADAEEPAPSVYPDETAALAGFAEEPAQAVQEPWDDDPFAGYSASAEDFGAELPMTAAADPFPVEPDGDWGVQHTMEMPRVDGGVRPKARDFRIASPGRDRGRRRTATVVAAGVVLGIAVAALVTYLLGFWGGIAVPDVTGMTESDARAVLEENGFSVRSTQIKSDDTEGLVVVMDPEAGSRAGEGSEVVIHISTARFVPEVTGKTEEEARKLLEESGYENVRYEKVKSEDSEGVVLSVDPEAGTRAKSNAEIMVSVSEAYRVPDISGLDLAAAEQAIVDSGLTYGVTYVDTDQYEDGSIIGTDPEQGSKTEKDGFVAINVARKRGAELVALTESMFAQGSTVTIDGVDYEVESLDAVSYEGDDVVSFTMTGLPRTTFFGKTIYADEQVVSGQIAYSEDNEVISIS